MGLDGRIGREREFHNERFSEESRRVQKKYYAAVSHGTQQYRSKVHSLVGDKDILELGCGTSGLALEMAGLAGSITGVDISEVAIERSLLNAQKAGLKDAEFVVMNAEELSIHDSSLDVVFGSGILHHLDLARVYGELTRVLRDDGHAIFLEPLGHNALINLYRRMTPTARTPDEHPLRMADLDLARQYFDAVTFEAYGLITLATVPLRRGATFHRVLSAAIRLDDHLFNWSFLARYAWFGLFQFSMGARKTSGN